MTMRAMVLFLGCAAGCGGSGSSSGVDQACANLATARCMQRQSCSNGASITRVYGDLATCLSREKLQCKIAFAASGSNRSLASTETCAAAYATQSCGDFYANIVPDECQIMGTRASGQSCAFGAQCASDFCVDDKTSPCGSCGAPPLPGTSCLNSGCDQNQECVAGTGLCQSYGASGDGCDDGHPCGGGLSCAGAMCQTAVAQLGASCGGKLPGCDAFKGLSCAGMVGMKSCVAIVLAGDGQPCGNQSDGSFVNCAAGTCYTSTGVVLSGQTGMCKANAADGAACDVALGPSCVGPARCFVGGAGTSGVCTVPDASVCG
jgi:hypothetical protein